MFLAHIHVLPLAPCTTDSWAREVGGKGSMRLFLRFSWWSPGVRHGGARVPIRTGFGRPPVRRGKEGARERETRDVTVCVDRSPSFSWFFHQCGHTPRGLLDKPAAAPFDRGRSSTGGYSKLSLSSTVQTGKKRSCVFWKSGREVLNRPAADHARDDEMRRRRRGRAQTFDMQPMVAVLCCSVRGEVVCAFMLCSSRGGNLPFLSPMRKGGASGGGEGGRVSAEASGTARACTTPVRV